jgi:hypothetical protein
MTWHTGSGQGQYGSAGNGVSADKFDPFHHQTKMVPSDGMQSRAYVKAIVVKGADGSKVAYAKTEMYLQQDLLTRRVAELVSGGDPLIGQYAVDGLDGSRIMLGGTHNHSAPMYASTAWGVWLFTDAFDFRMYEATARKIASAIKLADQSLTPARIGASVTRFDGAQQNILGPATADDGTPAGFPRDFFDDELSLIRFDALDPPRPIGAWVNLGMHPESLATADLISADFVGMTERLTERAMGREPGAATGPVVAWSQGSVGDVEPDQSRASPQEAGREYWHRNFAQAELMSRDLSAAVVDTWADVARGTPDVEEKFVPFGTDLEVGMVDYRFAGPESHPSPTVSNCRTHHPAAPVVGLPDCERAASNGLPVPDQWGTTIETLQEAGVPIPDDYGAPSHGAVQESHTIHLQAMRLGDILVASCPCEPISDMVLNFKSRADRSRANLYNGYLWPCEERADGRYCDFRQAAWRAPDWKKVDEDAYAHMIAEITNDAEGWEEDLEHLQGEVEAEDHEAIHGNYTHEELQDHCTAPTCDGYRLPIMVGQANDYVGYVVTYREYLRGDHYRKALTAFGPHTSDYINTRLVRMGAQLQGGPAVEGNMIQPAVGPLDGLIQMAKALAVGSAASGGTTAYEAAIPDDGGTPGEVLEQPTDLERFEAASLTWEGGSNWTDNPVVTVQRLTADGWETFATQEGGEIVLTLKYDSYASDAPLLWLSGGKAYEWTATYEVFDETPPGTYRFVVDGHHRSDRTANPYHLESDPFDVSVWSGIAAHDLLVNEASGTALVSVDGVELSTPEAQLETDEDAILAPNEVHYPDTYDSDLDFISSGLDARDPHRFCYRCTFRPWADTGEITSVRISVMGQDGSTTTYDASLVAGFWVAEGLELTSGDRVVVAAGDVIDEYGNVNGAPSNEVSLA